MNNFLLTVGAAPLVFLGIFSLILFFILYLIQYIYISIYLKRICKIIFNNENHFNLPLEPFNCFFISILPIVFWRELLNIKYGLHFKKLYRKDFYYPIDKTQLMKLTKKFPLFFYLQYLIYLSSLLFLLFGSTSYVIDKFF